MKQILKTEEAALLAFAVIITHQTISYAWWVYWAWFLAPDISMLGYLVNTRIGAFVYNLGHHKGVAVLCWATGFLLSSIELQFAGLVLLGHSSFDRVFGYGLKYPDAFKHTHLGWIGQKSTT